MVGPQSIRGAADLAALRDFAALGDFAVGPGHQQGALRGQAWLRECVYCRQ